MARSVVVGVDGSSCSAGAADWTAREASLRRLPLRVVHVSPWSRADLADLWPYRPEALPGCPAAAITCRCPRLRVEAVRLTGCPVPALTAETGPCGSRQYRGADVRPDEVALGIDARDRRMWRSVSRAKRLAPVACARAVHAWEPPCPADGWMPFAVGSLPGGRRPGGRAGADAVRRPAPVAGEVPANTGPEGRAAVHGGCCLGPGVDANGTARGGSAGHGTRPGRRCCAPRKVSLRCRALTACPKSVSRGEADGTSLRASPRSNGR